MSIDIDINEMFSEKNQEIFLNKLKMDLQNNEDSFKLATKHIVMVEFAKLVSSLKRLYDKYSVVYNEQQLKELLNKTKKELMQEVNLVIEDKTSRNIKFIDESTQKKMNKGFLKEYYWHIDETEKNFEENINLAVKEFSEIGFYTSLISFIPCKNVEMQNELIKSINVDFSHTVVLRSIDESKHRNMTLKNITEESFKKYLDLKENNSLLNKKNKIKVKKEKP